MERDTEQTVVIFKREGKDILAVFPYEPGNNNPETCSCYASIGQHAHGDMQYCRNLPKAKPSEYADLKQELESMGYNLKIMQRVQRNAYYVRRQKIDRVYQPKA